MNASTATVGDADLVRTTARRRAWQISITAALMAVIVALLAFVMGPVLYGGDDDDLTDDSSASGSAFFVNVAAAPPERNALALHQIVDDMVDKPDRQAQRPAVPVHPAPPSDPHRDGPARPVRDGRVRTASHRPRGRWRVAVDRGHHRPVAR